MPIYEPGLDKLVAENVAAGRLGFTTDLKTAIAGADAVVLTSSSAAQRLADALGADLGTGLPATVVCIGPVTAGTATTAGIGGVHVADVHSLDGLIHAVVSVLAR